MKDKNLPIKKKGIMLLYLIGSEWLVPQCNISNNDILAHYEIVLIVNIWKESNPSLWSDLPDWDLLGGGSCNVVRWAREVSGLV